MSVSVFAPISIGNVSVGFDILGLAVLPIDGELIGDIVRISASTGARRDRASLADTIGVASVVGAEERLRGTAVPVGAARGVSRRVGFCA